MDLVPLKKPLRTSQLLHRHGSSIGQNSAIVNAGINVQWTATFGTYFGYYGQFGRENYDSQGGTCSVHWDF